MVNLSHLRNR